MAKFIELHSAGTGRSFFVNPDKIVWFVRHKDGEWTNLWLGDYEYDRFHQEYSPAFSEVKETPEEILRLCSM